MDGFTVEYRTGDKIGKLKDIIVDSTKERWPVVGLYVSPGIGKAEIVLEPTKMVDIDVDEETIVVTGDAKIIKPVIDASNIEDLLLEFIEDRPVLTKDGEKIGKIYDAVVMEGVKPWKVWKVLIKTQGLRSRRLRMDVRDIVKITDEAVELKLLKAEIEELEQETEVVD
jgi:sporulation protein YlmC with PRC-barrel domain